MSFIETPRFPEAISQGSEGGTNYSTDVVTVKSGFEARNINWTEARRNYEASFGVRDEEQLFQVLEYFHAMFGRANTFRFKDWGDYNSTRPDLTISATDQTIGTGDGVATAYQLIKSYTQGLTTQRDIKKPVVDSVLMSIDDVELTEGFSVDTTTGIVTFGGSLVITNALDLGGGETRIDLNNHGLSDGTTMYIKNLTGDWSGINGVRYAITVVDIHKVKITFDSSAYAAYSSNAGNIMVTPQTGETVKAGYEFDVPCRFDTDTLTRVFENYFSGSASVPIVEVKL